MTTESRNEDVVLIHGILRTRYSMRPVARHLVRRGYRTFLFGYPSRREPIAESADRLAAWLKEKGLPAEGRPLHFVTHSMGGLVARDCLTRHDIEGAGKLVQLTPPNQGSCRARQLRDLWLFRILFGPAGQELTDGPEGFHSRCGVPDVPIGIIAGGRGDERGLARVFKLPAPGDNDNTVLVRETFLDGAADHIVLPFRHSFLMYFRTVKDQIVHFMESGRFSRETE